MIGMVEKEFIRKKHFIDGWSIRKISKNLNISRQTVRKALESSDIPQYTLTREKPSPVMDPYKEIIQTWFELDKTAPPKQEHTARRIYLRLAEGYGFTGAESTVRRYIYKLKRENVEMFVPLSAGLGEQAQVDWGKAKVYLSGKLIEISLFCMRLKSSLVPFVKAFPTERLEAFLDGHRCAFEWFGGVPETLLYDNPKVAVTKILKGPYREEHQIFSSLKSHYLFDSEFCNPAKGNEKGTVENLVKYVRRNVLVPVPEISSLEELNQMLLRWCEQQRSLRLERWQEEARFLRPLPKIEFRCATTKMVSSSRLLLFQFDNNYYSVPVQYGNKCLRLEAFVNKVEIYDRTTLIASHERCYNRGEKIMHLEHYLPILKDKPRAAKNALVVRKLPQVYQDLRIALCSKDPEGYREFAKILLLNTSHNFEDVLLAIEESFKQKAVTFEVIQQILIAHHTRRLEYDKPAARPQELINVDIPIDDPAKFNRLMGGVVA